MGIFDAKSSQKGQVTVPVEVRTLLGLEPGGKIQFRTTNSGKVEIVAKKKGLSHLKRFFSPTQKTVDIEAEIEAEIMNRNKPLNPRSPV